MEPTRDVHQQRTSELYQRDEVTAPHCSVQHLGGHQITEKEAVVSSLHSSAETSPDMSFQRFSPLTSQEVNSPAKELLDSGVGDDSIATPRRALNLYAPPSSEMSTTSTVSYKDDDSLDSFIHTIDSEVHQEISHGFRNLLHAPIINSEKSTGIARDELIKRPSSRRPPRSSESFSLRCRSKRPSPARQEGESPELKKRRDVLTIFKRSHSLDLPLPTKVTFKRCQSESDARIKEACDRVHDNSALISDGSKPYCLPTILGRHQDLTSITPETVARLLQYEFDHIVKNFLIIDCRYPYEYQGGHIQGARNIYKKEDIETELMSIPIQTDEKQKRSILIFHCEFSSERAPRLYRFLRNLDRIRNKDSYPELDYPEVYLLHGGYKSFYESYKVLCTPQSYVPMLHADYREELRTFRTKSKSWPGERKCRFNLF